MNLEKKKNMAARALGVGKARIAFNQTRLAEIKEAITKQDIRDLQVAGAIFVKEVLGRKKVVKRKSRRRRGSIRQQPQQNKRKYMILTRKLRAYIGELRSHEKITEAQYQTIRKQIKASIFKSKNHLKETITGKKI